MPADLLEEGGWVGYLEALKVCGGLGWVGRGGWVWVREGVQGWGDGSGMRACRACTCVLTMIT